MNAMSLIFRRKKFKVEVGRCSISSKNSPDVDSGPGSYIYILQIGVGVCCGAVVLWSFF